MRLFSNRRGSRSKRPEGALFEPDIGQMVTTLPTMLWIELTSKCPFKCIFCTREVRWNAGRNLDFDVYRSLIGQLDQLLPVTRYAMQAGASEIFVHPIIGRHPVPYDFSRELESNKLTREFKENLRRSLAETRAAYPALPITVLNSDLSVDPVLGSVPQYYAPPLPADGRIHTCDQSPFESVHVLANGDVVVCEVHDEVPLGNLHSTGVREIWQSDRYRKFRQEYVAGTNAACRDCVWKTAYKAEPSKRSIRASKGFSPQLTRGWWVDPGAAAIWSKRRSVAELCVNLPARQFRIAGILPHNPVSQSNELLISIGGNEVASIANPSCRFLNFDRIFRFPAAPGNRLVFHFATIHVFRRSAHSDSTDCRDLGFALQRLELR